MRALVVSAVLVALAATPAIADDVTGLALDVTVIEIDAGVTKAIPVGNAGSEWMCIPEGVLKATIVTKGHVKHWVITPRVIGRTQCRVGSGLDDNDRIFDIFVNKPAAKKPKPKRASKRGKSAAKTSAKAASSHGPLWEIFSQRGDVRAE
jgi:hypothetical protein